ncbi:T9SS type A sorting domain-containing protein [Flavobacterium nackdongense]|uniref:T9SS type A sorting domain-containing protein n=1 Tax=Flavobacterium nackdongense TaxID=2547394 RepID=A0A4P6YHQ5_9FLAO|nr:T9SS type A sorting domain-containing protein [Flavobacterium nackdongense]QBN20407.1 T9SS type A sorting domain-containing protein [Flavobacterium nackdongense]
MERQLPSLKRLTGLFYSLCILFLCANVGWGQQTIGTFPTMDGGMEGQTLGTVAISTTSTTAWTATNCGTTKAILNTVGGSRSGSKFATFTASTTLNSRFTSPTVATTFAATQYTVQYWARAAASPLATLGGALYSGASTLVVSSSQNPTTWINATDWFKVNVTVTAASIPTYGAVRLSAGSTIGDISIDDFVIYAGALDATAPSSPTALSVSGLGVSWTAPAGGVDGGGYVVVRYATNPNLDNDPNQNGIYASSNTITNGTGSLVGTVVYVGTATSFTDAVAGSSSGNDYYKVYAVDKAFNYSDEITAKMNASAPIITSTPATLTGFNYNVGSGPSTVQSFVVGGSNLTADIGVTPSANFEVSADNLTFQSTILTVASGSTVYTRLKAGLSNGTYAETLQLSSTGATNLPVSCTGSISGTYYYNGSGPLSTLTNWGTNTDGTGTNPSSLASANATFVIRNTTAVSTDAAWTLGSGSKIIVGEASSAAVALTIVSGYGITGTVDITAASSGSNSVVCQNATIPTFGTLHSSSEVHFQFTSTNVLALTATFGKLYFEATSNVSVGSAGTNYIKATIQTSLTIATGAFINFSNGSNSYFYINAGGTVTVNGTLKTSKPAGLVGFSIGAIPIADGNLSPALQFFDAETPGASLVLTGSTIEFSRGNSGTTQTIAPRTDYNNLTISDFGPAAGNKIISGPTSVSGVLTLNHLFGSTITGSANIALASGATILRTSGSFDAAPAFGSSVNVTYNGTTAISSGQEIPVDASVLNNLTINNAAGVTLTAATAVNNKLSLTAGTLTTGGFLTLKSNATKTAVVGVVTGNISGNATTERYIPAGQRAYRFLSSPVTTTTFIDTNWQAGTHITGAGGATNGFDATTGNNPSMFTYNNTTPAWNAVTNTNATVLASGVPYLTYIRGSRAASLAIAPIGSIPSDAATLSATGTLTTGNVLVSGLNETANGFSAVGNPYQAQVDMQAVLAASTNLNSGFYYVVDPSLGTKGAYLTVDVTAPASAHISQYLQPGQACFVNTVAAGPASLTFTEANKSEAAAQTTIFKTKNTAMPSIGLSLYDAASNRLDVLKIAFDASETNDVNQNDASKMTNFDESLASSNSGKLLAIEKRAMPTDSDEIPLNITKYRGTSYSIKAEAAGLTGSTSYLFDQFANKTIEIPQDGSVDYAYTVDAAIPASIAADRFKLIYAKTLKTIDNAVTNFALYPNPSKTNSFSVTVPQSMSKSSLTVSNMLGQQLYSQNDLQSGTTVNVIASNVKTTGVYLVSLTSEGKTTTTKWIVE